MSEKLLKWLEFEWRGNGKVQGSGCFAIVVINEFLVVISDICEKQEAMFDKSWTQKSIS